MIIAAYAVRSLADNVKSGLKNHQGQWFREYVHYLQSDTFFSLFFKLQLFQQYGFFGTYGVITVTQHKNEYRRKYKQYV